MNDICEIEFMNSTKNIIGEYNNSLTSKLIILISNMFNIYTYIFLIIVLYYYKILLFNDILIIIFAQIIVYFIKHMFKRERPFMNKNNNIENLYYIKTDLDIYSFPSSHTLNAFLITSLIYKNTKQNYELVSLLIGLSRIYLGVHYPSDIIGGIILSKIILLFFN